LKHELSVSGLDWVEGGGETPPIAFTNHKPIDEGKKLAAPSCASVQEASGANPSNTNATATEQPPAQRTSSSSSSMQQQHDDDSSTSHNLKARRVPERRRQPTSRRTTPIDSISFAIKPAASSDRTSSSLDVDINQSQRGRDNILNHFGEDNTTS
jgi:hypothetical protein